ncbi:MAG: hypothetical protein F4Z28_05120 [Gammaproteobacteria bacterium]|nr:hypothetical protein [Gammaproteobacteria bacterium]
MGIRSGDPSIAAPEMFNFLDQVIGQTPAALERLRLFAEGVDVTLVDQVDVNVDVPENRRDSGEEEK